MVDDTIARPSQGFYGTGKKGIYNRGTKAKFWGEQGNKDNIGKQGTYENKFSIFGEQGNKPIYFRGTREQVPPWEGLDSKNSMLKFPECKKFRYFHKNYVVWAKKGDYIREFFCPVAVVFLELRAWGQASFEQRCQLLIETLFCLNKWHTLLSVLLHCNLMGKSISLTMQKFSKHSETFFQVWSGYISKLKAWLSISILTSISHHQ